MKQINRVPIIIAVCLIAVVAVAVTSLVVIASDGEKTGSMPRVEMSSSVVDEIEKIRDDVSTSTETATQEPQEEEPAAETSAEPEESEAKPAVAAVSATDAYTDASIDPSYYRVINRTYPIPAGYIAGTGKLTTIEGKQMETKAAEALKQMVAALRAEGMSIIIQSGYRSDSDQEYLYNRQIGRQNGNKEKAATISAVPLTSEHQAGLAVDLSTDGTLLESFASTAQGKWLKAHCAEYGFILRYLPEKTDQTGIISEPWHFRYVGSPAQAQAITNSGLCLEEYFGQHLAPKDIDPYLPYLE